MTDYLIDPARYANIDLKKGTHGSPDEGLCLLEAVAHLAGEQHTDHPKCVSPVLGEFGRALNDVLPDDLRQELRGLIPSLPGTAGDGMDEKRSYMALDWLIRTWLPAWLDLVPACREDAARVRELGRIVDLVSAKRAGPAVRAARENADAAGAAVGAAAASAGDAAAAAARAAARAAAADAAADAAWGAAARAAAASARDAAADAAWAVLAPTVRELQLSAIHLFHGMINTLGEL